MGFSEENKYVERKEEVKGLRCPVCGSKNTILFEVFYMVPFVDRILIVSFRCSDCGYKTNLITPSGRGIERRKQKFVVTSQRDLYVKVLRSPFAAIKIPELEIEVSPGPSAKWFLTNIEGVLLRMKKAVESFLVLNEDKEKKEKAEKILKRIIKAIDGNEKFTVILEDPEGLSQIFNGET